MSITSTTSQRRYVRVTFEDGNQVETPINGTLKTICDYYHKNWFNPNGKGTMVEFLQPIKETT
jgi:hypothetical protein